MKDIVDGISVREVVDETTGISSRIITEFRQQGATRGLKPRINIVNEEGETLGLSNGLEARYYLPSSAVLSFVDGAKINAGDVIARIPRESSKTKDIIGGLPRVAEIVEARRPKDSAIIAEIDGRIEFGKDYKSKRKIIINPDNNQTPVAYVVPKGKHVVVAEGSFVRKGDILIDGNPVLHDILKVMGIEALSRYIVNEIQSVYKLQGVKIDDKHIEIVIKQMIQKVEITDPGQTHLFVGDKINKWVLNEINEKVKQSGLNPALGTPILQGITKSSLQTKSFISAASFQETTKVLTDAAICGKVDYLTGLKENVIVGRLIPAGTGFYMKQVKETAFQKDKELANK
jgi:DNA-directed RNA polymerase subunit beta'